MAEVRFNRMLNEGSLENLLVKNQIADQEIIEVILDLVKNRPEVYDLLVELINTCSLNFEADEESPFSSVTTSTDGDGHMRHLVNIGLKHSPKLMSDLLFEDFAFTEQEYLQYRTLHEILHIYFLEVLWKLDPDSDNTTERLAFHSLNWLSDTILNWHDKNTYFTVFASHRGLFERLAKHTFLLRILAPKQLRQIQEELKDSSDVDEEELVEMMTMFLWNKEYWDRYLDFLQDKFFKAFRKKHKLVNIPKVLRENPNFFAELNATMANITKL